MKYIWPIRSNTSLCTAYVPNTQYPLLPVLFTNGAVFGVVAEMQFVGNYKLSTY